MVAAYHPAVVSKIVLVSSGPFEASYAARIRQTRLSRLDGEEKQAVERLEAKLRQPGPDMDQILLEYGKLMAKADSFDTVDSGDGVELRVDMEMHQSVWAEASEWRASGALLRLGEKIACPVVAMHGDYDPHPADGVKEPLSRVVRNFTFVELRKCGHTPWKERFAEVDFYQVLIQELQD